MKNLFLVSCLAVLFFTKSISQQQTPYISFETESHDFGTIEEAKGNATFQFNFVNTGNEPLVLNNVRASCGCTTPKWTTQPILPGNKGFIDVSYNPKNRPGPFTKSITVTSNAENANVVLRISGEVKPKEKTMEDIYRYDMGGIRATTNHVACGKVTFGDEVVKSVDIINTADSIVSIDFQNVPKHLRIVAEPKVLKPNGKGKITVTYNSKIKNDWGFLYDRINILINGKSDPKSRLTVSADIGEDFTRLTPEQKANAPVISFETSEYDFGTIKQKTKASNEYVFTNTGKSNLIIRKVASTCGCTVVQPKKKVIAPGESSSLKVTFDAGTRKGKQQKSITVITNDPKTPTVHLKLTGNVEPADQ